MPPDSPYPDKARGNATHGTSPHPHPPNAGTSPSPTIAESAPTSLTTRTTVGLSWLAGQSVATKAVNTVGQVLLAWLLSREAFGLIAMAYTVSFLAQFFRQTGMNQILIHRQRQFRRWASAAFWLDLSLGLVSAALMAAVAPFAAAAYGHPRLIGLILVLAATAPFNSLGVVPTAKLQSDLRFGTLSLLGSARAWTTTGLMVLAAWMGLGVYSFVLPRLIVTAAYAGVLWWVVRPPVKLRRLHLRRWRFLIGDSGMVMGAGLCYLAIGQGDYVVLGLLASSQVVGIYYFAFSLSMQAVQLLAANLTNVLLPALSRIQEDTVRQTNAFLRATSALAVASVPFCFLQAALADPVIHILFDSRWYPSIPVLQILSIAMALRTVSWPAAGLLQAQGRFATRMGLALAAALLFLPLVIVGAWFEGAVGVAAGVLAFFAIVMPMNIYVAIRPGGGNFRSIVHICLAPLLVSAACMGGAAALATLIPDVPGRDWWRALATVALSALLYWSIIKRTAPRASSEISGIFQSLVLRKRKKAA